MRYANSFDVVHEKRNERPKMLEVSLVGVGTVLRLGRDVWSMVKWLRQATNEYLPPPVYGRCNRCVGSDVSADLHEHGELLSASGQVSVGSNGEARGEPQVPNQGNPNSSHGASSASLADTMGSAAGEQVSCWGC